MSYPPAPYGALPSVRQQAWQETKMYAFFHFTVNTFTGREWGDGTESPDVFAPSELDCGQWCRTIAEAGFCGAVLTAKHHDGFCLWPSEFTDHSVRSSKWRNGSGDVVREFVDAARKYGLKIGFYLSPWDRHESTYGTGDAYNDFYCAQLKELLTNYGGDDVFIIWFDGACGEGPNGKVQQYDFDRANAIIRKYAPNAVIWGGAAGQDIRWCGNEDGFAGADNYATAGEFPIPDGDYAPLQHGRRDGENWRPAEVDVSIRPGWFWHEEENEKVHSAAKLLDIYYTSVGRGSCLNLNLPPDRRGLLHETDVRRLLEFRKRLDQIHACDLCLGARAVSVAERDKTFGADMLIDGNPETFWAPADGTNACTAEVHFKREVELDVVELAEYTPLGERVDRYAVDYLCGGEWLLLTEGTAISFRREIRTERVTTAGLRLRILEARACPCISRFSAWKRA